MTAEQACSGTLAEDFRPIAPDEQQACIDAIEQLLHQEFPDDSGQWTLRFLYRESGYMFLSPSTSWFVSSGGIRCGAEERKATSAFSAS
ncbi:hypothetical protein RA955_01120 [Geobacillus proteiniphilus]|uniref:Uncharacterized protein n=1 Tax=Geobacillus proteiniphilus TaxID=860353 RepID=A0A1Q5SN75_9BACL|nr:MULTISPECIES: hypothetical protein [Geobacillus]OKO89454.1 hypothetical protein BRO54_3315 [Geobacillus proteiniphilus]OPW98791.1 hypothetical protein B1A75_18715 [Geobacillus sp. LEMMY01]WMJ16761.1 hypothetical protein RA955_01120 [Geobacillus proteiniphilus]